MNSPHTPATRDGQAWHPDNIPWQEIGADGSKYALLEGRRDQPGVAFTYAFWLPAGFWDAPHWHIADARIFVVSGKLKLAYGTSFDRGKAPSFGPGSCVLVPANAIHYDGGDDDTLIIGTAVGRWATHYVDPNAVASAGTIS
jgi:mannose-6-phosphate isomerase-like protein (cupin superfamily)